VAPAIDLARRHTAAVSGVSGKIDTAVRYRSNADGSMEYDSDWDDYGDLNTDDDDTFAAHGAKTSQRPAVATKMTKATPPTSTTPTTEADQRRQRPNTYLYCFGFPTRFDVYPRWADGVHGDDLAYVFGAPLAGLGGATTGGAIPVGWAGGLPTIEPFPSIFTRADRSISELVMRYWASFIRTG
jgi:Carboxylesterase family